MLADPSWQLLELFSGGIEPTLADFTVTPLNVMECSPVRCAVQAIAETAAQLPFEVFQKDPTTNAKTSRNDHPAAKLIGGNPNPWTPASLFGEQLTRDALLQRWGGFAEIVRAGAGPVELHRLDPFFSEVEPRHIEGNPKPTLGGPANPAKLRRGNNASRLR